MGRQTDERTKLWVSEVISEVAAEIYEHKSRSYGPKPDDKIFHIFGVR